MKKWKTENLDFEPLKLLLKDIKERKAYWNKSIAKQSIKVIRNLEKSLKSFTEPNVKHYSGRCNII